MSDPLLKPELYREQGDAQRPVLIGGECAACGYIFFPLQRYGCEKCGARELGPKVLAGAGRLLASARVRLHAGKGREAPFTVGSIALDDGPIVRTLLVEGAEFVPGDRMITTLVPVADADGAPRRDLRFAKEA